MNIDQLNRIMFFALDSIHPLDSPKISMFAIGDKYAYPPYLRFKFKSMDKYNPLYHRISKTIEDYMGDVKWVVIDNNNYNNYVLLPLKFRRFWLMEKFTRDKIEPLFEYNYIQEIDNSIADIEHLTNYIINKVPPLSR